ANYAALALLRNKLPAVIARWQKEHAAIPSARSAEVLAYLYRANGDLAAARKAAEYVGARSELRDDLIWEQGDWAALAERPINGRPPAIGLALQAVYRRLSGNAAGAAERLDQLAKLLGDNEDDWSVVQGLLLNERPEAAFERLAKTPRLREATFDLLVAQMRYREAFALADKPPVEGEGDPRELTLKRARALYLIGERDSAEQLFAKIAGDVQSPTDSNLVHRLIEIQTDLGLRDAAFDSAAVCLGKFRLGSEAGFNPTQSALEALFPKRGREAKAWWQFLRQKFPKDDDGAALGRLRNLLEPNGKPNADLTELSA